MMRAQRGRSAVVGILIMLILSGCAMLSPRTGMGALFATPEAAFADALGPQGWLSRQGEQLELHELQPAPEGMIATYSSVQNGTLTLGLADAKPRDNRWSAHGMFALPAPALGDQPAACLLMPHTMTGATFAVLTGRLADASQQAEALLTDGTTRPAVQRDDLIVLLLPAVDTLEELRIVDAQGEVVTRIDAAECTSEG